MKTAVSYFGVNILACLPCDILRGSSEIKTGKDFMLYKDYILSLQRRQARYVLYPLVILNWEEKRRRHALCVRA